MKLTGKQVLRNKITRAFENVKIEMPDPYEFKLYGHWIGKIDDFHKLGQAYSIIKWQLVITFTITDIVFFDALGYGRSYRMHKTEMIV